MKAWCIALLVAFIVCPSASMFAQEERPRIVVPRRGGQELFSYCVPCHKYDGRGGPSEGGNAANLRRTLLTAEEVASVITNGRLEKGMPSFAQILDDQKIKTLAKYIKEELKDPQ
jgi:mono/diheme cytochrome c family protein